MKEAIILAGGFGTRLQHIVKDVPKPMAPIQGIPFLSYMFDYLVLYNFSHVVLSTGYMHEKIEHFYGNQYRSLQLSYAHETAPLGTGGGILNALQQCENNEVFVLNGDTLFCINFNDLKEFHTSKQTQLSVVLREVEDTSRYGSVCIDNKNKITQFVEKNTHSGKGFINGGIYLLEKGLFRNYKPGENFSFEKEFMERNVTKQAFYGQPSNAYFIDIGVPNDYYRAQKEFPALSFIS